MKHKSLFALSALVLLFPSLARADVRLPAIISENAVLQQDMKVPIWGWADPNEKVRVTAAPIQALVGTGKISLSAKTTADKRGRWRVDLGPFPAGISLVLNVRGKNRIQVQNILVGEVWLCSGQSNMAMTVARCDNFDKEKAEANYPAIRMFRVTNNPQAKPQDDVKGRWIICSPKTVGGFSATAYFFGRDLYKKLKHPIGLINSSVGGTAIESWTSMKVQKNRQDLQPIFERWAMMVKNYDAEAAKARYQKQLAVWKKRAAKARAAKKKVPRRPRPPIDPRTNRNRPAQLYNGMIAGLIPYAIRGAIWYQGEHNARNEESAELYTVQLPLLAKDWRTRWGQGDFPFYWVQLPNFRKRVAAPVQAGSGWAMMRESMLESLKTIPNSGMAITIDAGDATDIHPKNKQAYGNRLAHLALANVYHKDVAASGPIYSGSRIDKGKIIISFNHTDGGLKAKGGELRGFAIRSKDGDWQPAQAKIEGNHVIVWNPNIPNPAAVRYAWADNPETSLYNAAGLPASPFRTDRRK